MKVDCVSQNDSIARNVKLFPHFLKKNFLMKKELFHVASVLKKINHNAVLVEDNGVEKIAIGKGIGFRAVPHRRFDMECAEKIFVRDVEEESNRFTRIQGNNSHVLKQFI